MTITLLTDFGTADYFVPAMKGVIHSLCPSARLVDLTHDIPPQDIRGGAFTLAAAAARFPTGTIHLAIVDPGVGSARRPLIVEADGLLFVGPDNGLFSLVAARAESVKFIHAERTEFFLPQRSTTFHGRDVFAPLTAWLARGVSLASFGSLIDDAVRLDWPAPQWDAARQSWIGQVIHVDHFGNCLTNLTVAEFNGSTALQIGGQLVTQFGTHFAEARNKVELFGYLGSAGYWEVGLWCASAAAQRGIRRGDAVVAKSKNLRSR
jgi:hypothetical protein